MINDERSFKEIAVTCADERLSIILGKTCERIMLFHLEEKFKVSLIDVWDRPLDFSKALKLLFGKGADALEKFIVEGIKEEMEIKSSAKSLQEVIKVAKRHQTIQFFKQRNIFSLHSKEREERQVALCHNE